MTKQSAAPVDQDWLQRLKRHPAAKLVLWNVVVALVVGSVSGIVSGGILLQQQQQLDDRRTEREISVSQQQADNAERLENLRFIRDRAEPGYETRPFSHMDLSGMSLTGLNLRGADLYSSNLRGARLAVLDGSGAEFAYTSLQGTHLNSSNFSGSRFSYAEPDNDTYWIASKFIAADMDNIDFESADLAQVDFTNATLTGSDLSEADLSEATLTGVCFDETTSWPPNFQVPVSNKLSVCTQAKWSIQTEARTNN